jgi:hypothetical protein
MTTRRSFSKAGKEDVYMHFMLERRLLQHLLELNAFVDHIV